MSATTMGNVIPFLGRGRSAPAMPEIDPIFEGTVAKVADIPAADLLTAASVSLNLARLLPGTVTSYDCAMKALLCLARMADQGRPDGGARR